MISTETKNEKSSIHKPRFYIVSVDIVQGFFLILMIVGHTALWWDPTLDSRWPNIPLFALILTIPAMMILAGFLFFYGFNSANSLLRRIDLNGRKEARIRFIKRGIIFFIVAELFEFITGLVTSPKYLLNYLLTWELFHMFSFSTFVLLLVFEIAWYMEEKKRIDHKKGSIAVMSISLLFVLTFFLLFHDYSMSQQIKGLYVELNINSILERVIFEDGHTPIIPWLAFPLIGGLLSVFLDLPHAKTESIFRKSILVVICGIVTLFYGLKFLEKELFVIAPVHYPASSSYVFISIGSLLLITMLLIIKLDINSIYSRASVNKFILPFILLSQISLTVYLIHNIGYVIPSDLLIVRVITPTLEILVFVGLLYAILFVFLAVLWQNSMFKYSLEWVIWKSQKSSWRWWVKENNK